MAQPLAPREAARALLGPERRLLPRRRVPSDEAPGLERISGPPVLSADGSTVAFQAHTVKDTTWHPPHFIQSTFVTDPAGVHLASRSSQDIPGNDASTARALSADGRLVAFSSRADCLVDDDLNRHQDVFLHDRTTGRTECLSVDRQGHPARGDSTEPALSADGRYAVFLSRAPDLVEGVRPRHAQVYLRDREAGTTRLVSAAPDGSPADGPCEGPAISADGRFVAWAARAANLAGGPGASGLSDIFLHDRRDGTTRRITARADLGSVGPALSADGSALAFTSHATNLVPGDTNDQSDVFVYDQAADRIEQASRFPGQSHSAALSGDGRFVAFTSHAEGGTHVHLHDRRTGCTRPLDEALGGSSWAPALSADGRVVAFVSDGHPDGGRSGYSLYTADNPLAGGPVVEGGPEPAGTIREEPTQVVVGDVRLPRR